jgi:hypothetical protein
MKGSCEHDDEPSGYRKFLSGCATGGFLRRAKLRGVS